MKHFVINLRKEHNKQMFDDFEKTGKITKMEMLLDLFLLVL